MSEAGRYEIRVKGHLDARWGAWFDGMALTHDGDGTTLIHGHVVDHPSTAATPDQGDSGTRRTREAHPRDRPTIQARISYSATLLTGKDQA